MLTSVNVVTVSILASIALFILVLCVTSQVRHIISRAWDQERIDAQLKAFREFMDRQKGKLCLPVDCEAFLRSQRHPIDHYYLPGKYKVARFLRAARLPPSIKSYNKDSYDKIQCHNLVTWIELAKAHLSGIIDAASDDKYVSMTELQAALEGPKGRDWRDHKSKDLLEKYCLPTDRISVESKKALELLWQHREDHNKTACEINIKNSSELFDTLEEYPLTLGQRQAVVIDEDANLVTAAAGTGKTSVIVAKVCYLIKTKLAHPNEILVMAYNKKAATELQERSISKLGRLSPKISTFHAAGLRILREAGKSGLRVAEWTSGSGLIDWMSDALNKALADPGRRERTIEFLTTFGAEDNREKGQGKLSKTYQGWKVKSQQEKHISDWLYLNGYWADYEKQYAEDVSIKYKPDWSLDHGVYLEHFGIDRDGNTAPHIDAKKYRSEMELKRRTHNKNGTLLLETFSYQFSEHTWQIALLSQLKDVPKRRHVSDRFNAHVDRLLRWYVHRAARLCASFLFLLKNSGMDNVDFSCAHDPLLRIRNQLFATYFSDLYCEYKAQLRKSGQIDFADMCNLAKLAIQEGYYRPAYKYVLVDEFQDITRARADLLATILRSRRFSRLLAVGDDWQSIYRFAGGDISVMTNEFERYFGPQSTSRLGRAFRHTPAIGRVASEFVQVNPLQLRKQVKQMVPDSKPGIFIIYYRPFSIRETKTRQQSREFPLMRDALAEVSEEIDADWSLNDQDSHAAVLVLGRQASWGKDYGGLQPKRASVTFSTIHASKGLQADYVVVLGLKSGARSFPSELTDDPVLEMTRPGMTEMKFGEERRLMYVALTRARRRVFLMVDAEEPSPFASELEKIGSRSGDVFVV